MKILFLVFNRPELTKKVLSRISEIKPEGLYVAADGPRDSEPDDFKKCKKVREIVSNKNVCKNTHFLFREKNLGPLHSVSNAIDWFFDCESEGIVIEDDCLPDLSFFRYCSELLAKYRNDERIFMVSGCNFIPRFSVQSSYLFSRLTLVWGWATWKRAWQYYDDSMEKWASYVETNDLEHFGKKRNVVFELINREYLNPLSRTWGVQWRESFLTNMGLSIVPKSNLVKNIGFGHPDATHHKTYHKVADLPVKPIEFPLVHPDRVIPNRDFDEESLNFYFGDVF